MSVYNLRSTTHVALRNRFIIFYANYSYALIMLLAACKSSIGKILVRPL